jgi:hypothetical protein
MPTLKIQGTIVNVAPGDYTVSISLSDKDSNLVSESPDTPINVPSGGGNPTANAPDVSVVE